MSEPVAVALGSNLGDRARALALAREAIDGAVAPLERISRIFETEPLGPSAGCYLNQVVLLTSDAPPPEILAALLRIEAALGRTRPRGAPRWGARTIDCDLLLCGGQQQASPQLVLPHPRLHERAFVLVPLSEVLPDWRHPRLGKTVVQMLAAVDRASVAPWSEESLADGSGPSRSTRA